MSIGSDMDMDAHQLHVEELGERHGRIFACEEQRVRWSHDPTDSEETSLLRDYAENEAEYVVDSLCDQERLRLSPYQQNAFIGTYRDAFLGGYRAWMRIGDR